MIALRLLPVGTGLLQLKAVYLFGALHCIAVSWNAASAYNQSDRMPGMMRCARVFMQAVLLLVAWNAYIQRMCDAESVLLISAIVSVTLARVFQVFEVEMISQSSWVQQHVKKRARKLSKMSKKRRSRFSWGKQKLGRNRNDKLAKRDDQAQPEQDDVADSANKRILV